MTASVREVTEMKYVALKPCNFGRQFFIGDNIPTEAIDHCMVNSLVKRGAIAELPDDAEIEPDTEDDATASDDMADSGERPVPYTKAELSRLSKAELVAEGEKLGLAFGDKTTNKEIIEAILKLQQ